MGQGRWVSSSEASFLYTIKIQIWSDHVEAKMDDVCIYPGGTQWRRLCSTRRGRGGATWSAPTSSRRSARPSYRCQIQNSHTGVRYRVLIQVSDRILCKMFQDQSLYVFCRSEDKKVVKEAEVTIFNLSALTFDHMCM